MSKHSKAQSHHSAGSRTPGAGVLRPELHDPYRPVGKLPEGSTCPVCHAQVHKGHWVRSHANKETHTAAQTSVPGEPLASGHALQRAHQGELEIDYLEEESRVRSTWTRDH